MKKILTLSMFFLFWTSILKAQTSYYIDALAGNDNNNGTSPATAWQSIARVNSQTLIPGDSVLFRKGNIFRGILQPQNSGNAGNPIVFSSYGNGDNPQLLGSEPVSGWTLYAGNVYKKSGLNLPPDTGYGLFEDDTNTTVSLIEDNSIPATAGHYYYDENLDNGTLYVYCSDGLPPSSHNIEMSIRKEIIKIDMLSHLEFSGLTLKFGDYMHIRVYQSDYIKLKNIHSSYQGHYGNPNFFFIGCNHILVENCVLYESYNSGIAFYPSDTSRPGNYNTVRACTINKVASNDGITIHENSSGNQPGNYYLIEDNMISECQEAAIDAAGDYHIFRNNLCFNNDEDAFQVHSAGDHILFEKNICYGNLRHGLLAYGNSSANTKGGHIIRNNLIYNMSHHALYTGTQRFAVYNNTFCNSQNRSEIGFSEPPFNGSTYKNNIVYNDTYNSLVRFFSTATPSSLEMDYNNYNVITADSINFGIALNNSTYKLSEIQNLYNRERHSFVQNPGFIDPANNDYHLNAGSPCIDTGDFLTRTTSAGSGMQIPVEDVIYFCDGFGITQGDSIQLEGQSQSLLITGIDTLNNILHVNQNTSWNAGDGVALSYNGQAPDTGAYEYDGPNGFMAVLPAKSSWVYPNPATDKIYFKHLPPDASYQIINIQGNILKSGKITDNQLDISGLIPGVYFIEISTSKFRKIRVDKIMKN